LVESDNSNISISRQAELFDISRASIYYTPKANEEEKKIMGFIDKIYAKFPFYDSRRIKGELEISYDIHICREHTQNLMRLMGIEAVYPKKKFNLSQNRTSHKVYPYLLKDCLITKPNQVWGTDITYIKLEKGWAYLTAILDWFSRYVIAWELSETLESNFCIANLEKALEISLPLFHNSDQGTQFTDKNYIEILKINKIQISMDGRGRCMDNIFTERLWRTVKYENIFLKSYRNATDARAGLKDYFKFYNTGRRHQSLNNQTPEFVYHNFK